MLPMSSFFLFAVCDENNTILIKLLSRGIVGFSDSSSLLMVGIHLGHSEPGPGWMTSLKMHFKSQ